MVRTRHILITLGLATILVAGPSVQAHALDLKAMGQKLKSKAKTIAVLGLAAAALTLTPGLASKANALSPAAHAARGDSIRQLPGSDMAQVGRDGHYHWMTPVVNSCGVVVGQSMGDHVNATTIRTPRFSIWGSIIINNQNRVHHAPGYAPGWNNHGHGGLGGRR